MATDVTVILPTYNRAHVLGPAIRSVFAQTHRDFELIVVDDGSTDNTTALLAGFVDPRLRVVRLGTNAGASFARNRGIALANRDLLAFIDSDDVWAPEKLERQIAVMARVPRRVGLCVCSIDIIRGGARWSVQHDDAEFDSAAAIRRILFGSGPATQSWLVRREAMQAVGGFDESLPCSQDVECALRLATDRDVVFMKDILVTTWIQPDSISASAERHARAVEIIVRKHRALLERHRGGYSQLLFRAGKQLALEHRRREACAWFVRALRVRPTNTRAWAGALLCATGLFPWFMRTQR